MISVTNNSSQEIEVSVNRWGNDGDSNFYSVDIDKTETWDRSDIRGFLVVMKIPGIGLMTYYSLSNTSFTVKNDGAYVNDKQIFPIN